MARNWFVRILTILSPPRLRKVIGLLMEKESNQETVSGNLFNFLHAFAEKGNRSCGCHFIGVSKGQCHMFWQEGF